MFAWNSQNFIMLYTIIDWVCQGVGKKCIVGYSGMYLSRWKVAMHKDQRWRSMDSWRFGNIQRPLWCLINHNLSTVIFFKFYTTMTLINLVQQRQKSKCKKDKNNSLISRKWHTSIREGKFIEWLSLSVSEKWQVGSLTIWLNKAG